MTNNVTPPLLPDYKGEPVRRTEIKFTGVGTGFTGLDVRPIVLELGDTAYFVVRVTASESASHKRDKDGELVRLQRVSAEDMAPISDEIARGALQKYAQQIEEAKAAQDGQLLLDQELAAEERERADLAVTGSARNTQS